MIKRIKVDPGPPFHEMSLIKEKLVLSIKEYLYSGILKHPTGQLANSIRGYVVDNHIYITSDKRYAEAIDKGRAPHVMYYLLGKAVPLGNGMIRRVTLKSLFEGKWVHPGHPGVFFIDHAVERLSEEYPTVNIRVEQ